MTVREGFPAGWSSDHEDSVEQLLTSCLTSMEVAQPPAWQWGNTARQGPSFRLFGLSRNEPLPLPSETFPKSALTHMALWAGPEGSTCSASLAFTRDSCVSSVVLKIIGMNDENWTLGCYTFFQYHLVVMVVDFSLLLYLERGAGRRWVLVL